MGKGVRPPLLPVDVGRHLLGEILLAILTQMHSLRLTKPLAQGLGRSRKALIHDVQYLMDDGLPFLWTGRKTIARRTSKTRLRFDLDDDALVSLIVALRTASTTGQSTSAMADAAHLLHRLGAQLAAHQFTNLRALGQFDDQFGPSSDAAMPRHPTRDLLFNAITDHVKVTFVYTDQAENRSQRSVWPVKLTNHGASLAAWCETRAAFRTFNLSSMGQIVVLDDPVPITRPALLANWRARPVT